MFILYLFIESLLEISEHSNIIQNLIDRIKKLEDLYNKQYKLRKNPHKCPICDETGNGKKIEKSNKNHELYMKFQSCDTCEGAGIIWG